MIFPTPRMYVVFRNAINKRQRDKYNEKIHKQSSRVDKKKPNKETTTTTTTKTTDESVAV